MGLGVVGSLVLAAAMSCVGGGVRIAWEAQPRPSPCYRAVSALADGTVLGWRVEAAEPAGVALVCHASRDLGATWKRRGRVATDADPACDLGDAHFLATRAGEVLCSYRRNHHRGRPEASRDFRIEVAVSRDGGRSWASHSVVAEASGSGHGLWASHLFERSDGALQCYYDDEVTPAREGLPGHQWVMMCTWDGATGRWVQPVVVSRAHDRAALSRDGMPSVVELPGGRLLCCLESVQAQAPHAGLVRLVASDDGGRTWSWQREERQVLYQPRDRAFNALAPWMVGLPGGALLCVFTTDEDRPAPGVAATGRLYQDLKAVMSGDGGRTWSRRATVLDSDYPILFPGVCVVAGRGRLAATVLVQYHSLQRGTVTLGGHVAAAR